MREPEELETIPYYQFGSWQDAAAVAQRLLHYAAHLSTCRYRGGHDCDCGLEEIRANAAPIAGEPVAVNDPKGWKENSTEEVMRLWIEARAMTPREQWYLAEIIANNVGYALAPEDEHPDSPHAGEPGAMREAVIEECAKIAEKLAEDPAWSPHYKNASIAIADKIRRLAKHAALASAPQPAAGGASISDFERVFRDACDEAGCEYDNEALLFAIAELKSKAAPARPDVREALERMPWWKILADNWRGRKGSKAGDSARDSCADELENAASRLAAHPQPAAGERSRLIDALDSPTIEALANIFSPRNNALAKSYSEQVADVLEPRFLSLMPARETGR